MISSVRLKVLKLYLLLKNMLWNQIFEILRLLRCYFIAIIDVFFVFENFSYEVKSKPKSEKFGTIDTYNKMEHGWD